MRVRCVPEEPQFASPAEEMVWRVLHDSLPSGSALVANQRFTDRHGDHEADLIVGIPGAGIAVVEVKGGHVTYDGQGWVQTGGGLRQKRIDPIAQGMRAKYALRSFLDRSPAWPGQCRVRLAHLAAFPFSHIPTNLVVADAPRVLILDHDDVPHAAQRIADVLTGQINDREPASQAQVDALLNALTGRLPTHRDLALAVLEREASCDLLTARQAQVLDTLRNVTRAEISGGAGSGKTWLALEKARRITRDGGRAALLCYSRGLAAFLRRRVELLPDRERPAYVGTFHGLGAAWGAPPGSDDDSDYWEHRLPAEMVRLARQLPLEQRFDAVVVDEAQDFADAWWDAVVAALKHPDEGSLYVFSDEGQRVFARYGRPPVQLLPVPLDENLRNTKQIAQVFGSLAPVQMRYRGGEGVPVRFVPCATEEAVSVADDEVVALLEAGWPAEHVALLTTGRRHPVQRERQETYGQDAYWASYWAKDDVFYGHVLGFKGLERPAVVLAVNGFYDAGRAREMLYVGLSRARDLLVVCGDPDLLREVGGEGVLRRLTQQDGVTDRP